jgi:large-conductance mechanosensitive channel
MPYLFLLIKYINMPRQEKEKEKEKEEQEKGEYVGNKTNSWRN